eukprot:10256151-Alexandrium_andersonii.AAC.1
MSAEGSRGARAPPEIRSSSSSGRASGAKPLRDDIQASRPLSRGRPCPAPGRVFQPGAAESAAGAAAALAGPEMGDRAR